VQDLDVLEGDAEPVGDDLAPGGLVTLPVGSIRSAAFSQPPPTYDRAPSTRDGARPHISVKVEMPMPSCTGSRRARRSACSRRSSP
jgi:hypothetical protein